MPKTKKITTKSKLSKSKININNNKELSKEELSKEELKNFIDICLERMKEKQKKIIKKHNFGKKDNKIIFFPNHKKFYMFNSKTNKAFFEAQFQIVGTYTNKSNTWRFAWANRYIPNDLKRTSLKLKEFGESNNLSIFKEPKVKDSKLGVLFTAIGMKLSNGKGYYIVPEEEKFPEVHLIFTKVKKINKSMGKINTNLKQINHSKKLRYEKYFNSLKI